MSKNLTHSILLKLLFSGGRLPQKSKCIFAIALFSLLFSPSLHSPKPLLAQQVGQQIYLPVVAGPPIITSYVFSASNDCGDENFTDFQRSPVSYPAGIEQLIHAVFVDNGIGYTYRLEWLVNGVVVPGLARTGIVDEPSEFINGTIYFGVNKCGGELPRGQYVVRLYLNEVLQREGTVTIQ